MIKTIVFDYSGVITPGPLKNWVKKNLNETDERYKLYKEYSTKWDLGTMTTDEVNKILSKITGVPKELIWEKIYLPQKPNKELIILIKKLKKSYKIILFSNFIGDFLRKLIETHEINNLFDEVIISSDHGKKKPDHNFFEILVKISGVKKNEIIFTDDKNENVESSNKFGIKAFLFTDTKSFIRDLRKSGIDI
jgi:epoxide hydrolase-like predicted phosphatase